MHCDSAEFVLRLLTEEQKDNRININQDILANSDADENLLKNKLGSS
jgi:hypothetical protein